MCSSAFGPAIDSFFGDVADQKNRYGAIFGKHQKLPGHFSNLRHRAGRRFQFHRKDRLHRINYYCLRVETVNLFKDSLKTGFRQQVKPFRVDAQSLAAQFDLPLALFARDVQNFAVVGRELVCDRKQQCRFSDPGVAAYQNQASRELCRRLTRGRILLCLKTGAHRPGFRCPDKRAARLRHAKQSAARACVRA